MKTNEIEIFSKEQIRDLPKGALARKYKCSAVYVRQVLNGTRGVSRPYLATKITEDSKKILNILNS